MDSESPVVKRFTTSNVSTTILLFVRLAGCPYSCLGRVAASSLDLKKIPIKVTWELLDYSAINDPSFPGRQQYLKSIIDATLHVLK